MEFLLLIAELIFLFICIIIFAKKTNTKFDLFREKINKENYEELEKRFLRKKKIFLYSLLLQIMFPIIYVTFTINSKNIIYVFILILFMILFSVNTGYQYKFYKIIKLKLK